MKSSEVGPGFGQQGLQRHGAHDKCWHTWIEWNTKQRDTIPYIELFVTRQYYEDNDKPRRYTQKDCKFAWLLIGSLQTTGNTRRAMRVALQHDSHTSICHHLAEGPG